MAEQQEKSFMRQDRIFQNSKELLMKKTEKGERYYKTVGIGKLIVLIINKGLKLQRKLSKGLTLTKSAHLQAM